MIIGLLEAEEGCSSEIVYVLNDKSEFDWDKYEHYSDLTKQLAPEILEHCDEKQLEKFKHDYVRELEQFIYDQEIPGKIDIPFINEEIIQSSCEVCDLAQLEEFDDCRGIWKREFMSEDESVYDYPKIQKLFRKYQKEAGLTQFC